MHTDWHQQVTFCVCVCVTKREGGKKIPASAFKTVHICLSLPPLPPLACPTEAWLCLCAFSLMCACERGMCLPISSPPPSSRPVLPSWLRPFKLIFLSLMCLGRILSNKCVYLRAIWVHVYVLYGTKKATLIWKPFPSNFVSSGCKNLACRPVKNKSLGSLMSNLTLSLYVPGAPPQNYAWHRFMATTVIGLLVRYAGLGSWSTHTPNRNSKGGLKKFKKVYV